MTVEPIAPDPQYPVDALSRPAAASPRPSAPQPVPVPASPHARETLPAPVQWMPALFRHTRVDARLYRPEVAALACSARIAADGRGEAAWLAQLSASAREAWALAAALEAACWHLPELADWDVPSAVAAWRRARPRRSAAAATDAAPRVWLPACPDEVLAQRLQDWLAAVPPLLRWLVTCTPDAQAAAADATDAAKAAPSDAGRVRRTHRVLHEPMAGRFDLIVAPALLAGVQPHVQRRLLTQWARLLGAGSRAGSAPGMAAAMPAPGPATDLGLLWVGHGAARDMALAQGWRRVGPGPLLLPPLGAEAAPDERRSTAALAPRREPLARQSSQPSTAAVSAAPPASPGVSGGPGASRASEVPTAPSQGPLAVEVAPGAPAASAASASAPAAPPRAFSTDQMLLALAREALVLRFEPQRSLATGRCVCLAAQASLPADPRRVAEGRAVWQAARAPANAALLGQWLLQWACREAARWPARGPAGRAPAVEVALPAALLHKPGWAAQLGRTLAHTGLAPERLVLCIGARSLLQPAPGLGAAWAELGEMGVRLGLARLKSADAALARWADGPLGLLKLDAGLLARAPGDGDAEAAVHRIAAFARQASLRVVADGVASEAQRHWLATLHCHAYQGPLAGEPRAAAHWLAPATRALEPQLG